MIQWLQLQRLAYWPCFPGKGHAIQQVSCCLTNLAQQNKNRAVVLMFISILSGQRRSADCSGRGATLRHCTRELHKLEHLKYRLPKEFQICNFWRHLSCLEDQTKAAASTLKIASAGGGVSTRKLVHFAECLKCIGLCPNTTYYTITLSLLIVQIVFYLSSIETFFPYFLSNTRLWVCFPFRPFYAELIRDPVKGP